MIGLAIVKVPTDSGALGWRFDRRQTSLQTQTSSCRENEADRGRVRDLYIFVYISLYVYIYIHMYRQTDKQTDEWIDRRIVKWMRK